MSSSSLSDHDMAEAMSGGAAVSEPSEPDASPTSGIASQEHVLTGDVTIHPDEARENGKPTGETADGVRSYELPWRFRQRVAAEHLGSHKYTTSAKALGELVANAFDANATVVDVEVKLNDLGGAQSIEVGDNGDGCSPDELRDRFVEVGVGPQNGHMGAARFGRFGVGRLAVHRIGELSRWTTVSQTAEGRIRIRFSLSTNDEGPLRVTEDDVPEATPLGTTIEILNLRETGQDTLKPTRIAQDLLGQFCSYLLGSPEKKIRVQGELLDVAGLVQERENEVIPPSDEVPEPTSVSHLILNRPVERSRFPSQLLFSAKGRTVAGIGLENAPSPQYLGLVECPYLDSMVSSNRETLIEMDGGFSRLKLSALERTRLFGERLRAQQKSRFIERARQEDYYPYRDAPADAVVTVQQAVYDVVLEKVNENANIEAMNKKQQAVVFRLLERALENEDVLEVLSEVARLSDTDIEKFRKVLEHTTLESIIRLSWEVTGRLQFLDVLHDLVYGQPAARLKERSQLHKIIERHCWLFGPRFHLAASDQSFRTIIQRHRAAARLGAAKEVDPSVITGLNDIPDLFLAAQRDYPIDPKHNHLLVEIKAPKVSLGKKEGDQVHRYAQTIQKSTEFDKGSTHWQIFLVSAKVTDEIEQDRTQKGRPFGCMWEWDNMTVWAFAWCEIITAARQEMQLVREHLQRKSKELTASDYLRESFPEILKGLSQSAGTTPAAVGS